MVQCVYLLNCILDASVIILAMMVVCTLAGTETAPIDGLISS